MQALWLVNQVWFIVPVNPWKIRASSELLYKSNRPQVSISYLSNRPLFLWVYRGNKPRGILGEHEESL